MKQIKIWTGEGCVFCFRAKALMDAYGVPYEAVELTTDNYKEFGRECGNVSTVPQIIVDGELIPGGYEGMIARIDEVGIEEFFHGEKS